MTIPFQAAQMFVDQGNREAEAKLAKEVELQKIHIKKSDIELIMNELEVLHSVAEKALRENEGNVVKALRFLIRE
jgi:NACalpha-BTF3-like transcription factor